MRARLIRRRQKGAALVEMALTLGIFMVLLLAIFEFALLLFSWSRGVEATRAGARLAVVTDPVVDLAEIDANDTPELSVNCGTSDCGAIAERMMALLPEVQPENITIAYRYSGVGHPERPAVIGLYEVTVRLSGVRRTLVMPGLLGLPLTVPMPPFSTTRISEDLHTPQGP